ncbi:hypothetical protein H0H92_011326, partial [Tricholoma furcatifolium]
MPQVDAASAIIDAPYFSSLNDLDVWAAGSTNRTLNGVLKYVPRTDPQDAVNQGKGKLLGCRIFEGGGEEDCLRLLVGKLPRSINGPAKATPATTSLPLSPHYAKLLAELAAQRGFDGYLLNFECPLQGGFEQSRTLAAWITVLQSELLATVGKHAETH